MNYYALYFYLFLFVFLLVKTFHKWTRQWLAAGVTNGPCLWKNENKPNYVCHMMYVILYKQVCVCVCIIVHAVTSVPRKGTKVMSVTETVWTFGPFVRRTTVYFPQIITIILLPQFSAIARERIMINCFNLIKTTSFIQMKLYYV